MRISNHLNLPFPIITPRCQIRPLCVQDSQAVNQAIVQNAEQLREWLPWAYPSPPTLNETQTTLTRFEAELKLNCALHCVILVENNIAGGIGLCHYKSEIPSAEIGYWGNRHYSGCGLITEAAEHFTRFVFAEMGFRRLVIVCDDENLKSAAVAERLGFTLEVKTKGLAQKPGTQTLRLCRQYARLSELSGE